MKKQAARAAFPPAARFWLALAALALCGAALWAVRRQGAAGAALFAAGGLLLALAAPREEGRLGAAGGPFRLWEAGLLALLLAAAAWPRLHGLGELPPGAQHHEGVMAYEIKKWMRTGYSPYVLNPDVNWPSLCFYQGWAFVKWLGWQAGNFRIPSVAWSLLSVGAFYFLMRAVASVASAIVATLLFIASTQHLLMARNFFPGTLLFFSVVAGFGLLFMGLRRRRWFYFAAAGFAAGLGLHGYIPGRTVFPLMLCWLGWLGLVRRGEFPGLGSLGWLGLGYLLCAAPVIYWGTVTHPGGLWGEYLRHVNPNQGRGPFAYLATFFRILPFYADIGHLHGDPSASDNLPHQPMLDPAAQLFVPLGIFFCLARLWKPLPALALAWIVAGMAPAMLSSRFAHPNFRRMVMVHPALYFAAGLALEALWQALRATGRRWMGTAAQVLAALAALAAYGWSYDWYFHKYVRHPDALRLRNATAAECGRLMREHPEAAVYSGAVWPNWGGGMHAILPPERELKRGVEAWDLLNFDAGRDALLLLDPFLLGLEPLLVHAYGVTLTPRSLPTLAEVDVPEEDLINHKLALLTGLVPKERLRAFRGMRDLNAGLVLGPEASETDWRRSAPGGRARFSGAFYLPGRGGEATLEAAPGWSLKLNGQPVRAGSALKLPGGVQFLEMGSAAPIRHPQPRVVLKGWGALDFSALRPLAPRGMKAFFTPGQDSWDKAPAFERQELEPFLRYYDPTELSTPFAVRFQALLRVPQSGEWGLSLDKRFRCRIQVDGQEVFNNLDLRKVKIVKVFLRKGRAAAFQADFDPAATAERRTFCLHARAPGQAEWKPADGGWFSPF